MALVLVSGALVWAVAALAYVLWVSPLVAQLSGPHRDGDLQPFPPTKG